MSDRNIVVLTIGGRALELQMANLPIVHELTNYILFVDNRAKTCISANNLKKLLKKHRIVEKGYNVEVYDAKKILEAAELSLRPKFFDFMNCWVKSIHCLMYWYGSCILKLGRTLYIEDDVLLLEGFDKIFGEQNSMKYISMFNSGTLYKRSSFSTYLFFDDVMYSITKRVLSDEQLLDTNINVGQVYFGDDQDSFRSKLEIMTKNLFNSNAAKSTHSFFVKRYGDKLPVSSIGNTFDERILGIILYECGIEEGKLNDKVQIIVQNFQKVKWEKVKKFIRKSIVHVVMSVPKDEWWDKLIERDEIKSEK